MKIAEEIKELDEVSENLQDEYEEYIKLKERVEVAVLLISSGEFISKETILRAIGTESALKAADKIRDAENKVSQDLDIIGYDTAGHAVAKDA